MKNCDFTLPTKARYTDRAAQREEEKDGTKPLSPWQITPACSISTPVCTVVSVGSWQRPELSSLLSWRSKGWSRTGGSCHVVNPGSSDTWQCKARVGPLHHHDPAEIGRGIPSRATARAQSLSSNVGTASKTGTTLLSSCLWCPHMRGHIQQCDLLLLRRTPGEDTIFSVPSEQARSDIKLKKNAHTLLPSATTSCQCLMTGPEQNSKATISPYPAEKLNSFIACNS